MESAPVMPSPEFMNTVGLPNISFSINRELAGCPHALQAQRHLVADEDPGLQFLGAEAEKQEARVLHLRQNPDGTARRAKETPLGAERNRVVGAINIHPENGLVGRVFHGRCRLVLPDVQVPRAEFIYDADVGVPLPKGGLRLGRQAHGQQRRQPKLTDVTDDLSVLLFHTLCFSLVVCFSISELTELS